MKDYKEYKRSWGLKRFIKSFTYAFSGLKYAFTHEQNFLFHIFTTILVIIFGFIFNLKLEEWLIVIMAIASVLSAELFNTAIERAVDLATKKENKLAKLSKDTASSAVLVFALGALLVGLLIFVPKLF